MAVGFQRERGGGRRGFLSRERQQACSGALFRHALFRQRQADVAVDEAVAHAVGERLAEAVGIADVRRIREQGCKLPWPSFSFPVKWLNPEAVFLVECT